MAKRKTVYSQAVIDFIKDSIKKQRLLPGQKVCEQNIASEMNVSRAPVREALNVLLGEGLVISGPHLGKRVTALSMQEIRDAYALGGAVYGVIIASTVDQYTPKDFAMLESLQNGFKNCASGGGKAEEYEKLRVRLHDTMLQYAIKRWDLRLLTYCANLSDYLLHKTHREVISAHVYHDYSRKFLQSMKSKDSQALEASVRNIFNVFGERLEVAGYDYQGNDNPFVRDKRFHIHKRRQQGLRAAV